MKSADETELPMASPPALPTTDWTVADLLARFGPIPRAGDMRREVRGIGWQIIDPHLWISDQQTTQHINHAFPS
jgi:hypothetical protein